MAKAPVAELPTKESVVKSLGGAADAARQAYQMAFAANPGADLSLLYKHEMSALAIWSKAEKRALKADPAVAAAQTALDAATKDVRDKLATLKSIAQWTQVLDGLVKFATTVAKFFA